MKWNSSGGQEEQSSTFSFPAWRYLSLALMGSYELRAEFGSHEMQGSLARNFTRQHRGTTLLYHLLPFLNRALCAGTLNGASLRAKS